MIVFGEQEKLRLFTYSFKKTIRWLTQLIRRYGGLLTVSQETFLRRVDNLCIDLLRVTLVSPWATHQQVKLGEQLESLLTFQIWYQALGSDVAFGGRKLTLNNHPLELSDQQSYASKVLFIH